MSRTCEQVTQHVEGGLHVQPHVGEEHQAVVGVVYFRHVSGRLRLWAQGRPAKEVELLRKQGGKGASKVSCKPGQAAQEDGARCPAGGAGSGCTQRLLAAPASAQVPTCAVAGNASRGSQLGKPRAYTLNLPSWPSSPSAMTTQFSAAWWQGQAETAQRCAARRGQCDCCCSDAVLHDGAGRHPPRAVQGVQPGWPSKGPRLGGTCHEAGRQLSCLQIQGHAAARILQAVAAVGRAADAAHHDPPLTQGSLQAH